jgi:hypothetical protein
MQLKRFLTLKEVDENGFKGLLNFTRKKNIGIFKLRKMTKLPYTFKVLPVGYYSREMAVKAYRKVCKQKGYFLTGREARECLPEKLVNFIEEAIERYRKICIREKYLVTMVRLTALGEGKLARFILEKIKYPIIRKMIGIDLPFRSPAHLSKYNPMYKKRQEAKKRITIDAYERICLKQKRMLSMAELIDLGQQWIGNAIRNFGGIEMLRKYCNKIAHLPPVKVGSRKRC